MRLELLCHNVKKIPKLGETGLMRLSANTESFAELRQQTGLSVSGVAGMAGYLERIRVANIPVYAC